MEKQKDYRVFNLSIKKEKDFEIYESITDLFMKNFPVNPLITGMRYNPLNNINSVLACTLEDQAVGGLKKGFCEDSDLMTIELIVVQKDKRNEGVGSKLLEKAELLAKKQGIRGVKLNPRTQALDFYFQRGYKILDDRDYLLTIQKLF